MEKKILPFNKTLIIIPTYNEIDNVEKMITVLFELYSDISLLIIEDSSPDGTAYLVKKLQGKYQKLYMVERRGKLGLATAYITGFKWALERDYDFIFEMDCDFSHDPHQVKDLLESAQTNDLVVGSRYIDGIRVVNWPMKRLLLSYFAGLYIRFITRIPILDVTGGFKCFSRKSLLALNFDQIISRGYIFQLELNYKIWLLGHRVKEVPIIFYEREKGQSKMEGKIIYEAFFTVLLLKIKELRGQIP